nr:MAG TPA: hypothetical protein [Caudoviricetes sp.]
MFFISSFLQPRRGICLKLKGYNFISFYWMNICRI